ncbi:9185_t:CDS:2 [Ambispora gerdemannii]|uniref:Tethering factor for nuclear proteasome STS1 n=1 Tax=Ambispora gerdemannii TaxID=144530 RepID=A0A9N8Z795_9GLOM|nr:9185_t:CDS:2 [Ambispora gerdemannii]
MSDHSPCIPVPRNSHQTNIFQHNSAFRQLRTPDISHQVMPMSSRFTIRERSFNNAGSTETPKVVGCKRKPSEHDNDVSMSDSRSPPSSPKDIHQDMDREFYNPAKRTKTGSFKDFPFNKLLATLDKPQLLTLINNLVDTHPHLQSEIASNIPRPTIQSVTSTLNGLEKRLQESFPYTKWGPKEDDYSFNRVKPAIVEMKNAILDYAAHFTSPEEFPTTTFTFLHLATSYAQRLPNWGNNLHNELKRDLLTKLADDWKKAINSASSKVSEGKIYGQLVVSEWAKNLAQHNNDTNGNFQEAFDTFVEKFGWIIEIQKTTTSSNSSSHFTNPMYYYSNPVMPV